MTVASRRDDEMIQRVERFVRVRDSGLKPQPLDTLEAEAVLIYDECVAAQERLYKARAAQAFDMLIAMARRTD